MAMTLCACNDSERQLERLVDKVYDRLSLEEKAAQLYGIYPGELLVDGRCLSRSAVRSCLSV